MHWTVPRGSSLLVRQTRAPIRKQKQGGLQPLHRPKCLEAPPFTDPVPLRFLLLQVSFARDPLEARARSRRPLIARRLIGESGSPLFIRLEKVSKGKDLRRNLLAVSAAQEAFGTSSGSSERGDLGYCLSSAPHPRVFIPSLRLVTRRSVKPTALASLLGAGDASVRYHSFLPRFVSACSRLPPTWTTRTRAER